MILPSNTMIRYPRNLDHILHESYVNGDVVITPNSYLLIPEYFSETVKRFTFNSTFWEFRQNCQNPERR
jgi:hypothetical protein